ncbi:ATP-binding protein [Wenjunlia tyrosinilytica]|nr:ATP-binding protein [Wenjunlia tyrosinilytica]
MPATSPPSTATGATAYSSHLAAEEPPVRKLYRSAEGRMLGGVARGLAGHLGLPVAWVRIAFAALVVAQGMGVALYAAFWFFVPLGVGGVELKDPAVGHGNWRLSGRGHERKKLLGLLAFALGVVAVIDNMRLGSVGRYVWPFVLVSAGVALVWRQADNARRARWVEMGRSKRLLPIARGAAGVVLVSAGVTGFIVVQGSVRHIGAVLQAALAIIVGLALLAGPYMVRMAQDLSAERRERIRAQERAEVAAHVHDSVLHTLTLIQRNADDPREVTRLARAQERELRVWLYRPEGEKEDEPSTLAEAVRRVAGEVEDAHGVPVEVVCVGDCPLDDRLNALTQAAREAMVNAAKYGGGAPVQVYAEVEEGKVFVFVRDRGPGFDLDQVPADRLGVRGSIIGRMERHGGRAVLRGVPGGGTEVELEMERSS